MVARQKPVDAGDHVVPIEQQIKRHDRDNNNEHGRVDNPKRGAEHGLYHLSAAFLQGRAEPAQGLGQGRGLIHQGGKALRQVGVEPREVFRRLLHQRRRLVRDLPHHKNENRDDDQNRNQGDRRCGHNPAEFQPLQPVGHRVHHIGNRAAHDEGQQHIAKEPKREAKDHRRDAPVFRLLFYR